MEVFKIFATMNLVDAISKPLDNITKSVNNMGRSTARLSLKVGKLAVGFGQVAIQSAKFLDKLTVLAKEAISFESKMAEMGKVVNFGSKDELQAMGISLQDLSLQIPITAEGFADIAIAARKMGVAKNDLVEFSSRAAKMSSVFNISVDKASQTLVEWSNGVCMSLNRSYALANAVGYLSSNMNVSAAAITEVISDTLDAGRAAGVTETQLAALAATGLSTGSSIENVSRELGFIFSALSQGASISEEAANAFNILGYDAAALSENMRIDSQGTILGLMEAINALPKENQLSVLNEALGETSVSGLNSVIGNLEQLRNSFDLVSDASKYAGAVGLMYSNTNLTTKDSLQLLNNSFNVLGITIGELFLPYIQAAAWICNGIIQVFIAIARSPIGSFLIKLATNIAIVLVGIVALIGAFFAIKAAAFAIGAALSPVLWPLLAICAAVALLTLIWETDFMGIATMVRDFGSKVSLVFQGVLSIFRTLKDGHGEMSAELAEKLEAAGLMGVVTTISRIIFRIMECFRGVSDGLKAGLTPAFDFLSSCLQKCGQAFGLLISKVAGIISPMGSAAAASDSSIWHTIGTVIGKIVATAFDWLIIVVGIVIEVFTAIINVAIAVIDWFGNLGSALGSLLFYFVSFVQRAIAALTSFGSYLGSLLYDAVQSILSFGGRLVNAIYGLITNFIQTVKDGIVSFRQFLGDLLTGIVEKFSNFSLLDAGKDFIKSLGEGIKAGAETLYNIVCDVLQSIRELLPFSDAKNGPLSNLTESGMAFLETFWTGIKAKAAVFIDNIRGIFGQIKGFFTGDDVSYGITSDFSTSAMGFANTETIVLGGSDAMLRNATLLPPYYEMKPLHFEMPNPVYFDDDRKVADQSNKKDDRPRVINIHIGTVELPDVNDQVGFVNALETIVNERG